MAFKDVLITLNNLISSGIVKDYAIGGGYAVIYYDVPVTTYDVDILVLLSNDKDFNRLYEHFQKSGARIENVYIFIGDMPVQFLPNYISPLFEDAIKQANVIEFENIKSKVVSIEHLIVLLLTAFRPKDRIRLKSLIKKADKARLINIIKRFDDEENKLYQRFRQVLEGTE